MGRACPLYHLTRISLDRMPIPIGEFISNEVYNGKLRSMHKTVDLSCLMFVDVKKGVEEQVGKSWVVRPCFYMLMARVDPLRDPQNKEEALTVVNLVRHYYRSQAFCIITPYDAQRGAIEMQLKAEGLHWECVYNVDSFQGKSSFSLSRYLSSDNAIRPRISLCHSLYCANHHSRLSEVTQQNECHVDQVSEWHGHCH